MSSLDRVNGALDEAPMVFDVEGESVIGVLNRSTQDLRTGVVFVVGGRQYRTGAQRQFVRLARYLASHGFSSFRFDTRGMGDNAACQRHFLETDQDISAAVTEFRKQAPWVERIVLWGLCDGASASICFAASEAVHSVVMVNPWITTTAGAARTVLKHHYRRQFFSTGFWKRFITGEVSFLNSVRSLLAGLYKGFGVNLGTSAVNPSEDLPDVVFSAIERYDGKVAIITSDRDLTAQEFLDSYDKRYTTDDGTKTQIQFFTVNADHSFSTPEQHEKLEKLTLSWCKRVNSV